MYLKDNIKLCQGFHYRQIQLNAPCSQIGPLFSSASVLSSCIRSGSRAQGLLAKPRRGPEWSKTTNCALSRISPNIENPKSVSGCIPP